MFQFIITHLDDMLIAVSGIIAGASALAALTPTSLDDNLLAKVRKVVDLLALNVGNAKTITSPAT